MLCSLKQKLDHWAINIAAKALPAGKQNREKLSKAADLMSSPEPLEFADIPAELVEEKDRGFRFRSSVALGLPGNDMACGKLFRAGNSWRTRPTVILVHGWNAELHYRYVLPRVARALNARGMNAALIELPLHMQRRPPRDQAGVYDFISDDLVTMLNATKQALADFHALALWARDQGSPAVAIWGFSLGAWLAGLYVSRSDLASHAILTTPIIDLDRAVRELPFCHPVRAAVGNEEINLRKLNLTSQTPRIAPDRIRVCRSEYDLFVPMETYEHLVSAWRIPLLQSCAESHLTVLISRRSTRANIDWLARSLEGATRPCPQSAVTSAA